MLYTHFTQEILGLQDVIITKVDNNQNEIMIHAELERKSHPCINCGAQTNTVHDYRKQVIKDIPAFGRDLLLQRKSPKHCRTYMLYGSLCGICQRTPFKPSTADGSLARN